MKRTALAALLLSSAFTVSAFAASDVRFTGELSFGASHNRADESGIPETADADPMYLSGRGSLFVPFAGTKLSATVDVFAEQGWGALDDYGASNVETDFFNWGGGVHFTYSQPGRYNLGIVGAIWQNEIFEENCCTKDNLSFGLIGAEGKFHFDRAAIWFQGGMFDSFEAYDNVSSGISPWESVGFIRGGVNYYLEDDLKLAGQFGYFSGDTFGNDAGYPISLILYKVEMEQRFSDRFSIFGNYQFSDFNGDYDAFNLNQNTFQMGFRVRLGQGDTGTLLSQEPTNSIGLPQVTNEVSLSNQAF